MGKKKNPFEWPFAKQRQCAIADADAMVGRADEAIQCPPSLPSQILRHRRAAKIYEQAAFLYRNAGLGLMALSATERAAAVYANLGDEQNCLRCEQRARAIPVYYQEEGER